MGGSCAYIDNKIYFANYLSAYQSYDVSKNELTALKNNPQIRDGKLVNFRGKPAVFGGRDRTNQPSKVIKVYDKDKNNWDTEIAYDSKEIGSARSVTYVNK